MPLNPSPEAFLSVRASCDRCHFQKLKCRVIEASNGSGRVSCERCARAMVPCIFGRRSRSTRRNMNAYNAPRPDDGMPRVLAVPTGSSSDVLPQYPNVPQELTTLILHDSSVPSGNFTFVGGDSNYNWISTTHPFTQAIDDNHVDLARCTLPAGSLAGSSQSPFYNMLTSNQDDDGSQEIETEHSLGPPRSWSPTSGENPSSDDCGATEQHVTASVKTLLKFTSEVHEKLEALESENWRREDGALALDQYPIGSVLHLLQRFTSLAARLGEARRTTQTDHDGSCPEDTVQLTPNSGMSTNGELSVPRPNTSTMLILMSCYVSLIHICVVVLGNFENHLRLPLPSDIDRNRNYESMLCLGELHPIAGPYHRIHAAVTILLSSLGQAEEALDMPPHLRHSATSGHKASSRSAYDAPTPDNAAAASARGRWALLASSADLQEATGGVSLRQKVEAIKELLRQHMGL